VELLREFDVPVFKLHNLDDTFPEDDRWAIRVGARGDEWEPLFRTLLDSAALVMIDPQVRLVGGVIPMVMLDSGVHYELFGTTASPAPQPGVSLLRTSLGSEAPPP
jgi:hypothetical protein